MVGSLVLLSPWGALVSLVATVPVLAVALAARRGARAARLLRLPPPSPRPAVVVAGLAALGIVLLGLAAAQPARETTATRSIRAESEALFVVDVSRSMLASASAEEPTRLDRAVDVVRRLRSEIEDVPAGVAGMTDRVLPYLFPTVDLESFDLALRSSVLPDAPPPGEQNTVATTFGALPQLVGTGFFGRGARNRACVLVTDGEGRTGAGDAASGGGGAGSDEGGGLGGLGSLGGSLGSEPSPGGGGSSDAGAAVGAVGSVLGGDGGCALVVVRVGGVGDRIHLAGGKVEGAYRPDAAASGKVQELADASGGWAFEESEVGEASAAVRAIVEQGPSKQVGTARAVQRLAPWAALAGALALAILVALRALRPEFVRYQLFEYPHSLDAPRGGHR